MKLNIVKRKKATHYYVCESTRAGNKVSTRKIKKLGTDKEIMDKYGVKDPTAWAREQVRKLNEEAKTSSAKSHSKYTHRKKPKPASTKIKQANKNSNAEAQQPNSLKILNAVFKATGIEEFCKTIAKQKHYRNFTQKKSLYNLLLIIVLNDILFPGDNEINWAYFENDLLKGVRLKKDCLYEFLQILHDNYEQLQKILFKSQTFKQEVIYSVALNCNNPLAYLSDKDDSVTLTTFYDNDGVPMFFTSSAYNASKNKAMADEFLDNINNRALVTNNDLSHKISKRHLSLKSEGISPLTYKEACKIAGEEIKKSPKWELALTEERKFNLNLNKKDKYDIYYRYYDVEGNSNYSLVAIYSVAYKINDYFDYNNFVKALSYNFILNKNSKKVNELYRRIKEESGEKIGYKYVLAPKHIDIFDIFNHFYKSRSVSMLFNNVYYDFMSACKYQNDITPLSASHIIAHIIHLVKSTIYAKSAFHIFNDQTLNSFMQTIDNEEGQSQMSGVEHSFSVIKRNLKI